MNTLGIIAKNAENELNVLEKRTEDKNNVLEGKLSSLQDEVHNLEALKTEMR